MHVSKLHHSASPWEPAWPSSFIWESFLLLTHDKVLKTLTFIHLKSERFECKKSLWHFASFIQKLCKSFKFVSEMSLFHLKEVSNDVRLFLASIEHWELNIRHDKWCLVNLVTFLLFSSHFIFHLRDDCFPFASDVHLDAND